MREDFMLCTQIMMMRSYSELSALEKRDAKQITREQRMFMDELEGRR